MKKRVFSVFLAVCLAVGLLPALTQPALAVAEYSPSKSIADSSLYFRDNGLTQYSTDNISWIYYTGNFTITGESVSDLAVTNTVVVESGEHDITLSGCRIGAASAEGSSVSDALSPFDIQGGKVNLTLVGENQLYSANYTKAGLHVAPNATLEISSEGSLDARCQKDYDWDYGRGAGIGGSSVESNGTITIDGGTVSAYSYNGAGIGSGVSATSGFGTVTINGGTVYAQTDNGCGIGYGVGSNTSRKDGTVTITGGSVNAHVVSTGVDNVKIGGTVQNNAFDPLQLYTLTLSGVTEATEVTELTTTSALGYPYGTDDMKTDTDGKLYVYLPADRTAARVSIAGATYAGEIAADTNTTTLSPLPPAAEYAAASPEAASGTDYELDDENKTLTIHTAKGAAFWSASGTTYLDYTVLLADDIDVSAFLWTPVGTYYSPFIGSFDGQENSITGLTVNKTALSGTLYAGLLGYVHSGTIQNVTVSGSVSATGAGFVSAGGIVGQTYGTSKALSYLKNCVSAVTVSARRTNALGGYYAYAGGLVGLQNYAETSNCVNTRAVTATVDSNGQAVAGGIAGMIDNTVGGVKNSYNTGAVHAAESGELSTARAGGIAGVLQYNTVQNCYSTGAVTASGDTSSVGGVVGFISLSGTVTDCYYLSGTAGKGVGSSNIGNNNGTGSGTFDDSGALTAGTEEQFGAAQTLAHGDALLDALNGWVNTTASTDYYTWVADNGSVNGGYPVFGAAWAGSGIVLTGVCYNVAAGTLTGTTANMEYSLNGGDWQPCTAESTTGVSFAAGTVRLRQKDKPENVHTLGMITAAAAAPAVPTISGTTTGDSITINTAAGNEYYISGSSAANWSGTPSGYFKETALAGGTHTFSNLTAATQYYIHVRVAATSSALPSASTSVSQSTAAATSSSGGGGGGTASPTGAPVIVGGKTVNIGTEKKSGGTTTVTVDQGKLGTNINNSANGSSVVVTVSKNATTAASLVVKNIEDMAKKGMTLTVQSGTVAYNLNAAAIDTAALVAAFPGADMSKVPFNVAITNSAATVAGETLVLSPVEFTVTAAYNGKTVSVDTFNAYINREIEVTAAQAANITTAVVVNADGSVRHVPTNVVKKNGKYYAIINSRTNSTYALIQNEVTFADATGKWYEAAANEMGSRKIIGGRSADIFDGGASITRAEFTVILVRALGLPGDGTSRFSDIPATAWCTGAVAAAAQYGIVSGKSGNRFEPNVAITRQEAMVMLQRAAVLTEFAGTVGNLDGFADADSVGVWAKDAAKWNVGSGLIQGTDGKLNPTASITRAQSAVIILRLLQKAELVDVRS